jgi:hypothetical protein
MSQDDPSRWIPVKMFLQFTAQGEENRIQIQLFQRLVCPICLPGKCQMMVFWVSTPYSTAVFPYIASTFRVTDLGSSAHYSDWEKEKCWLGSFKDFGQSKLLKGEFPANVVERTKWGRWPWKEPSTSLGLPISNSFGTGPISSSCIINPLPLQSHFCIHLTQTVTIQM